MSKKFTPGYNDALGILVEAFGPGSGGILAQKATTPTNSIAGYAPGCLFQNTAGAAGAQLYINQGSLASSTWVLMSASGTDLTNLTATAVELNALHNQTLTTGAGAGITGGTGTVYKNSVIKLGGIFYTNILIDLTGLGSSTTDGDIIGVSTPAAHIGQITAAQNGTILGGTMTCLEVPAGGADDIDLFYATEGTGKFDDAISGLTEIVLITSGGPWTLSLATAIADFAASANKYLYLCGGEAGTAATYTAGKFLIQLWGV